MSDNVIALSGKLAADLAMDQAALDANTLLRSDKGVIKACEHNARVLLANAPQYAELHFDDFLSRLRLGERDWSDGDDLEVLCWLQSAHAVAGFTLGQARNAAKAVAYCRRRDSLREFIEALPPWDGIERVALALSDAWGAPDTPLTRAASRNLFVALVARACVPGCQVDSVWCFEGPQGVGKSRALRALGGSFHAEITAPIGTADFMRELRGLWIAELSELDSLRGREASTVKRLLSATADRFVQKYALHADCYPRRAVAVASTNEAGYWQDATGARRLIPVACGTIRLDLIEATRLQWFAEAVHLYCNGASWWEFPATVADAQEDRQSIDPWEDALREGIAHGRRVGIDGQGREPWPEPWIASAVILRDWLGLPTGQQSQSVGKRLGHVMRRLGFAPERRGNPQERGWARVDTHASNADQVSVDMSEKSPR